jgi:arginyl-tRNA synthetase
VTPDQLSDAIVTALATLSDEGRLSVPGGLPSSVGVERPKVREHGDYATNVALQLAKKAGLKPRELAAELAKKLLELDGIGAAEVAGPGFLNLRIDAGAQGVIAADVVRQGHDFGRTEALAGRRINLEFVSANPTGPLHLGATRWAAAGESLARIFEFTGADVTREYYFNDHGAQIDRFARSLLARARGREVPEDGYAGAYIEEISADVIAREPGVLDLPDDEAQEVFRRVGIDLMFDVIKADLHDFGVDFDVYFHENSLHESGAVDRAIDRLKNLGMMYEADGAWWLRTSDFGDDKDRVVIRSDGQPAYISGDLAYYLDKRERASTCSSSCWAPTTTATWAG